MLNHEDDAGTQLSKIAEAGNELIRLNNELMESGNLLNQAEIDYIKADDKVAAKVKRQELRGNFARIKALIKTQKEVISIRKYMIKAEHNQFGV